jgi:hypothetical protein
MPIDWTNPNCSVTAHFTVNDCLMLHAWNRLATEADGADFDKLTALCQVLETVRTLLGAPMNVHCMFRSTAYNQAQSILLPTGLDVHAMNLACDFDCGAAMSTDDVKAALMPQLEALGIRLENNGAGASWVHIDLHPVINSRFFSV